ncbi:MAG TPA: class I SAM-dependent methyltransferase [Iamia sp.]|nr:class I SAM-dependent methyltransferase [Iamia sp.]
MATTYDYRRQALTYDRTRAASPSVLEPLAGALGRPGSVLDVGGGTGNYSAALRDRGWRPVVADRSPAMLARARDKALPAVLADATRLPVPDGGVDAVVMVSMLHHVPDWPDALAEARRAVRPGGCVALVAFGREHLDVHWLTRYLPTATAHFATTHQRLGDVVAALPGAVVTPLHYADVVDGSMAALCRRPELLVDPDVARQTSFVEWAADHAPEELERGMERLRTDLAAGRRPQDGDADLRRRLGDASLISWVRPDV